MKRANHLFEKMINFQNLLRASKKAFRRGKRFKRAASFFYFHLEKELFSLQEELKSGSYIPRPYRVFEIREPKVRKIAAADFRDRVVHHAICNILEPLFEQRLIFDSYACRVGKGSHGAIQRLQYFSQKNKYFLKCDIQKYFESIDHQILKELLRNIIKDKSLLQLLDQIIDHSVPGNLLEKGLPIGNLTSQHFANIYLGELDHFIKERCRIKGYIRYMDDFIVLSDNKEYLHHLLKEVRNFLNLELNLILKEKVIRIAPVSEGIPFLGFRIYPSIIRLQRTNLVRWRKNIRKREKQFLSGEITEENLINSVRSMMAHIEYSNSMTLRRKEITNLGAMTVSDANRVMRGGSWNNNSENCRSAYRNNNYPDNRKDNIGARFVSTSICPISAV